MSSSKKNIIGSKALSLKSKKKGIISLPEVSKKRISDATIPYSALIKWSKHVMKELGWIILSIHGYAKPYRKEEYLRELDELIKHVDVKKVFSAVDEEDRGCLLEELTDYRKTVTAILNGKKSLSDLYASNKIANATKSSIQSEINVRPFMFLKCEHDHIFKKFGWVVKALIDKESHKILHYREHVDFVIQLLAAKLASFAKFGSDAHTEDKRQDIKNMHDNLIVFRSIVM